VGVDRNGKGAVDVFVEAAGSGEGIVAVVIGIIIEFAGGVRDCSHVTPSLYVGGI
ncbi:unnamed protein product, partial [Rotaria socialis]